MVDFTYSKEQEEIFTFAKYGMQNLLVQAVAGAGKTSSLVECANRIDSDKKVMLLAHNRSTRDTLKQKIGDKDNIKIYTLHGLAWRMFNENFGFSPTIEEDKYRNYVNENIDSITSLLYKELSKPSKMIYKANVLELINKARTNLKQSGKEIKKLATKKYGMRLIGDESHVVASILQWGCENTNIVDYQDLLWFPSEFGYYTKRYLSDIIMLDEAQDASIAQQDVVSRCFKRNTRLFAFGDKDQTINSWSGSDSEAFEHLKDPVTFRRDAKELPLTTNYRCGKLIIEYAKKYTDQNIHAREGAPDGIVRHEAKLTDIKNGDMVLCRNIAPLMDAYRKEIALGNRVYFRGEELGNNLKLAVDCAEGETMQEIIFNMKRRLIATWEFFTKISEKTEREAMTDPVIISLLDTIKALEALPKTVENRNDFEKFTKEVFSDEGKDGIQLSTIHRAKGLEADNVFIICPSLIPSRLARLDWELEEERHLQYVMCTRPKDSLNFVTEKDIAPSNAFSAVNEFYNELITIKNEVKEIL